MFRTRLARLAAAAMVIAVVAPSSAGAGQSSRSYAAPWDGQHSYPVCWGNDHVQGLPGKCSTTVAADPAAGTIDASLHATWTKNTAAYGSFQAVVSQDGSRKVRVRAVVRIDEIKVQNKADYAGLNMFAIPRDCSCSGWSGNVEVAGGDRRWVTDEFVTLEAVIDNEKLSNAGPIDVTVGFYVATYSTPQHPRERVGNASVALESIEVTTL